MAHTFACPHCGQLLSVAPGTVGQGVRCIRCQGGVIVPSVGDSESTSSLSDEIDHEEIDPTEKLKPPGGTVEVSRVALYTVGGIIIASALLSFFLGWNMGRLTAEPVNLADRTTWQRVTGRVTFVTQRGESAADSESVVIALPAKRKPDEKLDIESFRPDVAPSDVSQTMTQAIRSLGGGYTRVDRNGVYEIELPAAEEYFVLIISSHAARPVGTQPTIPEIYKIGKYFNRASDLVARNDFLLEQRIVKGEVTLDHQFGNN